MKKFILGSLLAMQFLWAEIPVIEAWNIQEIINNKSRVVTIKGEIVNTAFSANQKVRYLNFGDDFTTAFSIVIFSYHMNNFKKKNIEPVEYYLKKNVSVTGKIKIFKDHPEIIVAGPDQIKVED
ncbi:MAG: hypothetical protein JXQ65_05000 [Candidatus Marinimicrobia bacterium]|nr:hypothetical protein [Candidatus Neomarinimicrobiota bacterium]